MECQSESEAARWSDALARVFDRVPPAEHEALLSPMVDAERCLLAQLDEYQTDLFWDHQEKRDQLYVHYLLAALDAGRQAKADAFAEAAERIGRILSEVGTSLRSRAPEDEAENPGDLVAG